MKAMFISKELNGISGAGVGARMHLAALKSVVGENNVFVIDVSPRKDVSSGDNYIAFGKYKSKLDRIFRMIQGNTYLFSNKIIKLIVKLAKKKEVDFIFVDDSYYGMLVKRLKKKLPSTPVVVFFHDVKAALFPIWMKNAKWIDSVDMKIGIYNEKISAQLADKNIILNQSENELLKKYYGKGADFFFPVCVDKNKGVSENLYLQNGKKHILFVGTAYTPNIVAIKWFCKNVFLKIRHKFDWYIVGKGLEILTESMKDENIHITGYAEDLAPYYEYADIVIAPLTDGGGMKIKTAEAISYGKIFLGSSESLHGYYEEIPDDCIDRIVFRCDTAEEYMNAFRYIESIKIEKHYEELVDLYEEKYSPMAAIKIMQRIIEKTTHTKL